MAKVSTGTTPKSDSSCGIKVMCRFRPQSAREREENNQLRIEVDENSVTLDREGEKQTFGFDVVFDSDATQTSVYERGASLIVKDALEGFNGTILTYGQTGTGKTFTMFGLGEASTTGDEEMMGLVPRVCHKIFSETGSSEEANFVISCSYLEVFNETVADLLDATKTNLAIRESPTEGIYVQELSQRVVQSIADVQLLLRQGEGNKTYAKTQVNNTSSRAHSVFSVNIFERSKHGGTERNSKLSLVDLAGSEKVDKTGATGEVLTQAKYINTSLSALGNCINALATRKAHVPFRNSKLTRILQESLSGNTKTTLIVCVSPHSYNFEETLSTLRFAQRAKLVQNKVVANVHLSSAILEQMLKQLRGEISSICRYTLSLEHTLSQSSPHFNFVKIRPKCLAYHLENLTDGPIPLDLRGDDGSPAEIFPAEVRSIKGGEGGDMELRQQLDAARTLQRSTEELVDKLQNEIDGLERTVEDLQGSISRHETTAVELQTEIASLTAQLDEQRDEHDDEISAAVERLERAVAERDTMIAELEAASAENEGFCARLQGQLNVLEVSHTEFVSNLKSQQEEELKGLRSEIENLIALQERLESELRAAREKLEDEICCKEKMVGERGALEIRINNLGGEVAALKASELKLESRRLEMETGLAAARETESELRARCEKLFSEIEASRQRDEISQKTAAIESQTELSAAASKIEFLQTEVEKLKSQICVDAEAARDQLASVVQQFRSELEVVTSQLAAEASARAVLESSLLKSVSDFKSQSEEMEGLRTALEKLSWANKDQKKREEDSSRANGELSSAIEDLTTTVGDLSSANAELQSSLSHSSNTLANAEAEIETLKQYRTKVESEGQYEKEINQKLMRELEHAHAELSELKDNISQDRATLILQLENERAVREACALDLASVSRLKDKLDVELSHLRACLQSETDARRLLTVRLEDVICQSELLEHTNRLLNDQVDGLQKQIAVQDTPRRARAPSQGSSLQPENSRSEDVDDLAVDSVSLYLLLKSLRAASRRVIVGETGGISDGPNGGVMADVAAGAALAEFGEEEDGDLLLSQIRDLALKIEWTRKVLVSLLRRTANDEGSTSPIDAALSAVDLTSANLLRFNSELRETKLLQDADIDLREAPSLFGGTHVGARSIEEWKSDCQIQ